MSRFTIRTLLVLVALIAVGLAAMKIASPMAVDAAETLLIIALATGLVGAIVRRGEAAWVGFTVFGWLWAFLTLLPFGNIQDSKALRREPALEWVVERIRAVPAAVDRPPFSYLNVATDKMAPQGPIYELVKFDANNQAVGPLTDEEIALVESYRTVTKARSAALNDQALITRTRRIGQCLTTLLIALAGGWIATVVASWPARPQRSAIDSQDHPERSTRTTLTNEGQSPCPTP